MNLDFVFQLFSDFRVPLVISVVFTVLLLWWVRWIHGAHKRKQSSMQFQAWLQSSSGTVLATFENVTSTSLSIHGIITMHLSDEKTHVVSIGDTCLFITVGEPEECPIGDTYRVRLYVDSTIVYQALLQSFDPSTFTGKQVEGRQSDGALVTIYLGRSVTALIDEV